MDLKSNYHWHHRNKLWAGLNDNWQALLIRIAEYPVMKQELNKSEVHQVKALINRKLAIWVDEKSHDEDTAQCRTLFLTRAGAILVGAGGHEVNPQSVISS